MEETVLRMTNPDAVPSSRELATWMGADACKYWKRVAELIERNYPGIFTPEWLFGGKKHGWSLRYKKGKSFCTFIPEKGRFQLLMVFGTEGREKVDAIRQELSGRTRDLYDSATTYHDGKWVLLCVDSMEALVDVERLLALKRAPRKLKG